MSDVLRRIYTLLTALASIVRTKVTPHGLRGLRFLVLHVTAYVMGHTVWAIISPYVYAVLPGVMHFVQNLTT